jgi:hypothetical protein
MSESLREQLDRNPVCKCGHTRLKHFVGGPISDCDKCVCQEFEEENLLTQSSVSYPLGRLDKNSA